MISRKGENIPTINYEDVYKRDIASMNEALYTAYKKIVDLQKENKQLLYEMEVLREKVNTRVSWEI